jgi:hypothetical protein
MWRKTSRGTREKEDSERAGLTAVGPVGAPSDLDVSPESMFSTRAPAVLAVLAVVVDMVKDEISRRDALRYA